MTHSHTARRICHYKATTVLAVVGLLVGISAQAAPEGSIRAAFIGNRGVLPCQSVENHGGERNGEFDLVLPMAETGEDWSPERFRDWVLSHTAFGRASSANSTGFITYVSIFRWSDKPKRFLLVAGYRIKEKTPIMPHVKDGDLILFTTTFCNWGGPPQSKIESAPE